MVTMLCLVAFVLLAGQPDWSWSVHPESGFKVLVPVELIHEAKMVPTDVDVIQFHQYHGGSVTTAPDSLAFVIDHYVMPSGDLTTDESYLKEFFENTLDQLLVSVNGTLVYMDIIHQPGRDVCIWKGNYEQGKGVIRGNILVYADHFYYGLQVFGPEEKKSDEMMSKFLNSFKRTPESAP
jgi:hypothetical protein